MLLKLSLLENSASIDYKSENTPKKMRHQLKASVAYTLINPMEENYLVLNSILNGFNSNSLVMFVSS